MSVSTTNNSTNYTQAELHDTGSTGMGGIIGYNDQGHWIVVGAGGSAFSVAGYQNMAVVASNTGLVLATASTPRMTISSTGYVAIGMTPGTTEQFQLSTDLAMKASTSSWATASDSRLKTDIEPFTDGLSVLNQLNPVTYAYNGLGGTTEGMTGIGFVAQDALPVIPYIVGTYSALLNPTDTAPTTLYNVNNGPLTYVLVNAVKNLELQTVQPVNTTQASALVCSAALRGRTSSWKIPCTATTLWYAACRPRARTVS